MSSPVKVCYTAIMGSNYDDLNEPTVPSPNWRFICFTDQPITMSEGSVWEIRQVACGDLSPQRMARRVKLLAFAEWEESLWLDASFAVQMDLNLLWANYFRSPFTAPKHPLRTDVYHEIDSCIANYAREPVGEEKQTPLLLRQKEAYRLAGVPNFGNNIITSGVLMRSNAPEVIELCNDWWDELQQWSVRDQVAFARVSIGREFHMFSWDYSTSRKELIYKKHRHLRQ